MVSAGEFIEKKTIDVIYINLLSFAAEKDTS